MLILITGVPASGKSFIAKELAKKINFKYINEKDLLMKNEYEIKEEAGEKIKIIDPKTLNDKVKSLEGNFVLEGLVLPETKVFFDYVVILYEDEEKLKKRMKKRKYGDLKIEENLFVQKTNYFVKHLKSQKNILLLQRKDKKDIDLIYNWLKTKNFK